MRVPSERKPQGMTPDDLQLLQTSLLWFFTKFKFFSSSGLEASVACEINHTVIIVTPPLFPSTHASFKALKASAR